MLSVFGAHIRVENVNNRRVTGCDLVPCWHTRSNTFFSFPLWSSKMNTAHGLRIATDIGGTFTDTVLVDDLDRVIASCKTLTTHEDPSNGALSGALRVLIAAGRHLGEIKNFIHGATLATNALLEHRGSRVATVTTEGFRDILEIAYERRYDQYDINLAKPDPLVPRERAFTVCERMSASNDQLVLDFDGTFGQSAKGINVPLNYAAAYAVFAMRCIIGPDIPNNAG